MPLVNSKPSYVNRVAATRKDVMDALEKIRCDSVYVLPSGRYEEPVVGDTSEGVRRNIKFFCTDVP